MARVGKNTILRLIKDGKLPAKRIGKRLVIRRVDMEHFLNPSSTANQKVPVEASSSSHAAKSP